MKDWKKDLSDSLKERGKKNQDEKEKIEKVTKFLIVLLEASRNTIFLIFLKMTLLNTL